MNGKKNFFQKDIFNWDEIDPNNQISEEQKRKISDYLNTIVSYKPKVGILGKTGAGKSSLCNAIFGADIAEINDVEACTRFPQEILVGFGKDQGIILVDVPGVGESIERDVEYTELYKSLMPELDVIIWVLKADDRAYQIDEEFHKSIISPFVSQQRPLFIVLNQVDKINPFREWNEADSKPGANQAENIRNKISVVSKLFCVDENRIIGVSSFEKYNIAELVERIVFALPKQIKMPFLENVKEENRTENAKKEAERGFLDTVSESLRKVVETYKIIEPYIPTIIEGVKFVFKLIRK